MNLSDEKPLLTQNRPIPATRCTPTRSGNRPMALASLGPRSLPVVRSHAASLLSGAVEEAGPVCRAPTKPPDQFSG
jgi:hypothetical protein